MAKMDGRESVRSYGLLQPHLLTKPELIEILQQRCVALESVREMTKEMLINLYNRVVLPLPQRENRSRRGAKNNEEVKKPIACPETTKESGYSIGFNGDAKTGISTSSLDKDSSRKFDDRLKPPPELRNNAKKVRLTSSLCSSLDNIVINERKCRNKKREQTSVKINETSTSAKNGSETKQTDNGAKKSAVEQKKVPLKRNFTEKESNHLKSGVATSEKKQRRKITWP